MVINRERLSGILLISILLSLVGNVVAYQSAVYLLCPEPAVSLECFDLLRAGMAESEARGRSVHNPSSSRLRESNRPASPLPTDVMANYPG
jgi:hypothetical protein